MSLVMQKLRMKLLSRMSQVVTYFVENPSQDTLSIYIPCSLGYSNNFFFFFYTL